MSNKGLRLRLNRETKQLEHLDPEIRARCEARRKEEAESAPKPPLFDTDPFNSRLLEILEEAKRDCPKLFKSDSEFSGFSDSECDLGEITSRSSREIHEYQSQ